MRIVALVKKQTHVAHHIVARAYLAAWHKPDSSQLIEYSWLPNKLNSKSVGAGSTGFLPNFYSLELSVPHKTQDGIDRNKAAYEEVFDNSLEVQFFTKFIDDPVGVVFKLLREKKSFEHLTLEQKMLWTRWLIAQWVRVPNILHRLSERATEDFIKAQVDKISQQPAPQTEYEKHASAVNAQAVLDSMKQIGRNTARQALPTVIQSEQLTKTIFDSSWCLIELADSEISLVVGDHPLHVEGALNDIFFMSIPLLPRLLFCATNEPKILSVLRNESQTTLVRRMNIESISHANKFVWACDDNSENLICNYLKPPTWNMNKKSKKNNNQIQTF
ncbi:DUF4238 domain-containing protein [Herminiimonas aquatilis]|uniref:DUF4238 domain-containing protein n=1 Tax=Herminiimonas aquatilis TaxID=345342 RepID=A0ABW2J426_9BURK